MTQSRNLLLPLLSALFLLSGCPAATEGGPAAADNLCSALSDTSAVVGQVGDIVVTQSEFDAELLSIPERARARYQNEKDKGDLTNRILLNKALFNKVAAEGLLDDPTTRLAARIAAEKAYVNALFKKLEADAVSDASVMAHYEENKARFTRPMARARHILVKDEALANSILADIKGGGDFAALAKKHSEDRGSKVRGGELPWATRDRWVPAFAEATFALEVDQITPLVETKYGFHIIQLLEKRDRQPIEEVRPGIERLLSRNAVRDYREAVRLEVGLPAPGAGGPPSAGRPPNPHGGARTLKLPSGGGRSARVPVTGGKPVQVQAVPKPGSAPPAGK